MFFMLTKLLIVNFRKQMLCNEFMTCCQAAFIVINLAYFVPFKHLFLCS